MSTSRQCRLIVGAFLVFLSPSLALGHEPMPQGKQSKPAAPADQLPDVAQFRRPELVAIAWTSTQVGFDPETAIEEGLTAWRPDGSAIDAEELKQIKGELREFGSATKPIEEGLRPLHLVFRIDERARNSQRLNPCLIVGDRRIESLAAQEGSSGNRLALSILAPSQREIVRWPAMMNVEIRVPMEEGDIFKTLPRLSESAVEVEAGARLYWTTTSGMSRSGRKVFPAIALEIDRERTRLVEYDFFTHLKDGTTESFNSLQPTATHDIRISQPLENKDVVDKVDVWRLRYRTELYEKVPTFPDRLPK